MLVAMEITVDGRKVRIRSASTVADLLGALKLNPEETLVKVNGKLAPGGKRISPKDSVRVMRVIFGG